MKSTDTQDGEDATGALRTDLPEDTDSGTHVPHVPNGPHGPRPPKTWLLVMWPAFLAACLLSILVFAVVSPSDLHWGDQALQASATTVYSLAFFAFWAAAAAAGGVTAWLMPKPGPEPHSD